MILLFVFFWLVVLNVAKFVLYPVYRLLVPRVIPLVVRTPEERFEGLDQLGYNFTPNYLK